jgi:ribonuclease HII
VRGLRRDCDFRYERAWLQRQPGAAVAGIDEAGRGPLAGPVLAAAVILPIDRCPPELRTGLDDSKKLSAARRDVLYALLHDWAEIAIGVGQAEVAEIDSVNILNATHRAMARAVAALGRAVDVALVDGNRAPPLPGGIAVETIVGGDGASLSIAAASIVAKVSRDRAMAALHREFPAYGWDTNMGYGTAEHLAALARLGPTPHHRRSFAPVRAALGGVPAAE